MSRPDLGPDLGLLRRFRKIAGSVDYYIRRQQQAVTAASRAPAANLDNCDDISASGYATALETRSDDVKKTAESGGSMRGSGGPAAVLADDNDGSVDEVGDGRSDSNDDFIEPGAMEELKEAAKSLKPVSV